MASSAGAPVPSLGWVRFFDARRGIGSILDVARGDDVFVHYSNLRRSSRGWRGLRCGEYVQFLRVAASRGPAAVEVTGPARGPLLCEADDVEAPKFYDHAACPLEPRAAFVFSPPCPSWTDR